MCPANTTGRPSLGIIGFGNFGRFAAAHLVRHFAEVVVHDPRDVALALTLPGCTAVSLEQAASARKVLLAVPLTALRGVLDRVAPHLETGALVMDVASVKVRPLELMRERLPPHVDFVGTHPLFGPQSGAGGLRGLKIALCGGRCPKQRRARLSAFLSERLQLQVFEVAPDEHDRQMAYVQALTHLLGWTFKGLNPPPTPLSTLAYDSLRHLADNVRDDSIELFHTIQRGNPFAAEVRQRFINELQRLIAQIKEKP